MGDDLRIAKGRLSLLPPFPMGHQPSRAYTPLNCILKYWDKFDPQTLKKQRVISFCSEVWPKYSLEDGKTWPSEGSVNYNNTIVPLDLFCRKEGKWSEVPYVQAFFALRDNPNLCKKRKVEPALLAVISCLPSPNESLFKGTPPKGTPSRGTPSKETLPRETPPQETLPRELQRDPPLLRRTLRQTHISYSFVIVCICYLGDS